MNDFTKKWAKAAVIRCIRTFAQTLLSLMTVGQIAITSLDWVQMLEVSATAAVASLLTSIAGLPEVEGEDDENG